MFNPRVPVRKEVIQRDAWVHDRTPVLVALRPDTEMGIGMLMTRAGVPENYARVRRALDELVEQGLVRESVGRLIPEGRKVLSYSLTQAGEREVEKLNRCRDAHGERERSTS
jgi:DNA-binding PadR family transcriptional regulator